MGENLPHASQELNKTTVAESQGNDNVGFLDTTGVGVYGREHKRSQSESTETKRSWVGKLSMLVGLPQPRVQGASLSSSKARSHLRVVMMVMAVVSTIDTVRLLLNGSSWDVGVFGGHCGVRVKSTRVVQAGIVLLYKTATRSHSREEVN